MKSENVKLKKEMEAVRGKLTLMTSTARRKEKEVRCLRGSTLCRVWTADAFVLVKRYYGRI